MRTIRAAVIAELPPARRARSSQAKDVVRQSLIDAGRELLLAKPVVPISLRGIARHAGYSSGVVYRYFADRDALFLAIRDSEMANFIDKLEIYFPKVEDPVERLLGIADRAFDFARDQIAAFGMNSLFLSWVDATDAYRGGERVHDDAPAAARIHAFFEEAVLSVMPSGQGQEHPQIAVSSFMTGITGAVLLPGSSNHANFPDARLVMHEVIAALITRWHSIGEKGSVRRNAPIGGRAEAR